MRLLNRKKLTKVKHTSLIDSELFLFLSSRTSWWYWWSNGVIHWCLNFNNIGTFWLCLWSYQGKKTKKSIIIFPWNRKTFVGKILGSNIAKTQAWKRNCHCQGHHWRISTTKRWVFIHLLRVHFRFDLLHRKYTTSKKINILPSKHRIRSIRSGPWIDNGQKTKMRYNWY